MSADVDMQAMGRGDGKTSGRGFGGIDPSSLDAREALDMLDGDFAHEFPAAPDLRLPGPKAEALYLSDASIAAIQGPVGSGKTTTLLRSRLRRAKMMPRSCIDGVRRYRLLVVRETYRHIWSTTIPSYLEVFPKAFGDWSGGKGGPVTHVMQFEDEYGPIEMITEFMAFGDNVLASLRGYQATDIWLNEGDTMPVDVLTVGIGRINRYPAREHFADYPVELQSYGQIVIDLNAPDQDNWTFGVFHREDERKRVVAMLNKGMPAGAKPIEIAFFNQPGAMEPGAENLQNLAPGYYETQIAALTLAGRGDQIDRLIHNKIVYLRVGEPVFKREFSRQIHVSPHTIPVDPRLPLLLGLDQGFKGAAVIAQSPAPGIWRVLAELMYPDERLFAHTFGERLRDVLESPRFASQGTGGAWGDMAGEHGASQSADENATWNLMVSRAAGITIKPQRIGANRLQPRLEAMRASLETLHAGQPGLLIDPSCNYLIAGFEARYVWTDEIDRHGDKRKIPDKSFVEANVMDALQYLLLSQVNGRGESPGSHNRGREAAQRGATRPAPGLVTGHDVLNPYGARQ